MCFITVYALVFYILWRSYASTFSFFLLISSNFIFIGEDGQLLQQAIRLYAAGHTEKATLALQHPIVLKNCTSFGGTNPIRNFLLQRMNLET